MNIRTTVSDILHLPLQVIHRITTQRVGKTFYRLKFLLTEPSSLPDHFLIYKIKRRVVRYIPRVVPITDLELGHKVSKDTYFMLRVWKWKCSGLTDKNLLTKSDMDAVCPSDDDVKVVHYGGRYVVISGNGRTSSLVHSGFKGEIEVLEGLM